MITGISIVSVWVLDQDAAKEFYTRQLGFGATKTRTIRCLTLRRLSRFVLWWRREPSVLESSQPPTAVETTKRW
jgi:hypothetical protein